MKSGEVLTRATVLAIVFAVVLLLITGVIYALTKMIGLI